MFPEIYTDFVRKINAIYDGDPNGNYVMAEDVNELQEAIERLERTLGIKSDNSLSINQRISNLERYSPLKVPTSIFLNSNNFSNNTTNSIEKLGTYSLISYKDINSSNLEINQKLKLKNTKIFGQINANEELEKIQELIGEYKKTEVTGIHILNLGNNTNRNKENNILNSIHQNNLEAMIQSSNWNKLFDETISSPYNPDGEILKVKKNDIYIYENFAFYDRQYYGEEISSNIQFFLKHKKEKEIKILGNSKISNQKEFSYIQAYALIYSLDYLFVGEKTGISIDTEINYYSWPVYISDWKTTNPIVFSENNYEYRNISDGRIVVNKDLSISLDGYTLDSTMIKYIENSIPGWSIKDLSINPGKLSHYDVDKIIEQINAGATLKIDPEKIDVDPDGGNLPVNIPSSNMKTNVILAVNQKNDADTTEEWQILDAGLKNLNAKKLFGDIEKDRMLKNIISTINSAPEEINVPSAKIEELTSSTIQSTIVNSTNATIEALNVTNTFTSQDGTIKGILDVKEINGEKGYFIQLKVDNLTVDNLKATDLQADNISSLILDTIELNVETGVFNKIVSKSLESKIIKTELMTAMNTMVGEAVIDGALIQTASIIDAQIVSLNANKLSAGEIDTGKVSIMGPDGHMIIRDNNIKIYDKPDEEDNRRLRVLIGNVSEITNKEDDYGLVVLGKDGTTRLYDNTGVYNAGIHENAVSNEKIQEDAVDSRVIKANSIFAYHIVANEITTEKLKAGAVTADKIAVGAIVAGSAIIADAAISNAQISELHGAKIITGTITAKQIKAGSISAEKLAVGYQINLIKNGFDSFETFAIGTKVGFIKSGAEQSIVSSDLPYIGDKSLLVRGNNRSNKIVLDTLERIYSSTVMPKRKYIFSAYVYTDHTENVGVRIGGLFKDINDEIMSEDFFIKPKVYTRIYTIIEAPENNLNGSFIVETLSSNVNVWFDCLQIEEKQDEQEEPGWYRSTEITKIDGSMVKTGYIEAKHVRVGEGTIFGNGDIITLSNQGIKAQSQDGTAMMNSKGIEIIGGAFYLKNDGVVTIDGKKGIAVTSNKNEIEIDANKGIAITKKINDEKIMYTTVDGDLYLKGKLEIVESDTIYTKDEIDKNMKNLDKALENIQTNLSDRMSINLGMKLGYSNFNVINNNFIYFFGYKTNPNNFEQEPADVDGYIKNWENNNTIKIPKQAVGLIDVPKKNGYIVWDNTHLKLWIIVLDTKDETWKKYNTNNSDNNTNFMFNESMYVVGEVDLS